MNALKTVRVAFLEPRTGTADEVVTDGKRWGVIRPDPEEAPQTTRAWLKDTVPEDRLAWLGKTLEDAFGLGVRVAEWGPWLEVE